MLGHKHIQCEKCQVTLAPDEELVGVIAIGYGMTDGRQHKSKSMERLCKPCSDKWFINGMKASVLAPTGLNKQRINFHRRMGIPYPSTQRTIARCPRLIPAL